MTQSINSKAVQFYNKKSSKEFKVSTQTLVGCLYRYSGDLNHAEVKIVQTLIDSNHDNITGESLKLLINTINLFNENRNAHPYEREYFIDDIVKSCKLTLYIDPVKNRFFDVTCFY